jgi:hypothetical protein
MELKTVFTNVEPANRNVIWLSIVNGVLLQKVYTAKGWQIIGSPSIAEAAPTSLEEPTDKYIFRISDNQNDLTLNIDTAADIGLSKTVNVHVIGRMYGVEYDTVGVYHNGEISAVQGDTHIVFDVNFDTGEITQHSYYDLSTYIEGVELEIGDSDEVKQSNLEKLRKVTVKTNVFSAHINYGIGVGSWVDGVGGFAHITTSQGYNEYYNILKDGSVIEDMDYITPTSLYSKYKEWGGTKAQDSFYNELFTLIG